MKERIYTEQQEQDSQVVQLAQLEQEHPSGAILMVGMSLEELEGI